MFNLEKKKVKNRNVVGCGVTFLFVGMILALAGYLWPIPQLTYTRGTIVESQRAGPSSARDITYTYTAGGARYRGECFLRYAPQFEGMYDVGASFPVYFENDHPESSYAPSRPRSTLRIAVGILVALLSSGVLALVWVSRARRDEGSLDEVT